MTEQSINVPDVVEDIVLPQPEIDASPKEIDNKEEAKYSSDVVTKIVKRERDKAYEKGKREALMELQQQQAQQEVKPAVAEAPPIPQQNANQPPPSLGGIQQLTPDQIKQLIQQEAPRVLQEHATNLQHQQFVNSFVSKMQAAETKYPGLEQKLNELNYTDPELQRLIMQVDRIENSGDVMNELLENPHKLQNLKSLIASQPAAGARAIQSLSNSIKQNTEGKASEKTTRDPLSQEKPSLNAGKDDGDMAVTDFQAMFRKRRK